MIEKKKKFQSDFEDCCSLSLKFLAKSDHIYYFNLIIENAVFEGGAQCAAVRVSFMTSYLVHLMLNIIF